MLPKKPASTSIGVTMTKVYKAAAKHDLKPYVTPSLLAFGHFRDLTRTAPGTGGKADGGTGASTKQNAGQ